MSLHINQPASVVILRSGHHGGLGIIRSLGRLRVPVYTVDADWWEAGFSSRYCYGRFLLDTAIAPPAQSIARLIQIARTVGGRPLLIPTTDTTAIWMTEHAAALEEAYCFPRQNPTLVRILCDKSRMTELAHRNGVPTAQSIVPRTSEDLDHVLATMTFPVIAKAIDADRFRRYAGGSKCVLHTPRELIALYAKARADEPCFLIQELIPGEDWMFDGYFDASSECLFGLTGKKIRRFPVNTGVTSLGICLPNETVAKITANFMKAIGYSGILDIGYRYDIRDGKYKVLDVNPRIGCTFRLFTSANGLDVARVLYLDMTAQPVPPAQPADGRKWIVEDFDLFSSLRSFANRSLNLKEWLQSFHGIEEAAVFAWDDPLPSVMMATADACEIFQWLRCRKHARNGAAGPQSAPSSVSAE